MMILRTLLISWMGIRSRPGRSTLTALSLFVGVLAIVVIQAGAGAAQDAVIAEAILANGRALTLSLNTEVGQRSLLQADQLSTLLNNTLAPVKGVSVMTVDAGSTAFPTGNVEMNLVKGNLRAVRPFPIRSGKWIGSGPDIVLPVVINEAASSKLGLTTNMTVSIRIGKINGILAVRIIGIVTDGLPEPNAYAPLDISQPWVKQLAYLTPPQILVHAEGGTSVTKLSDLVRTEYTRIFGTESSPEINRLDQENDFAKTLSTIRLIFSAVAGLSLIVGAMGILNIGLSTLRERSDELSLRRSFGATRFQVIAIIVLEGQIVALSAACIAIFVGLISFPFVASSFSQGIEVSRLSFPMGAVTIGVLASCFAALIGSLTPAFRAGRVPIASIMRI